ncbi:MAG: amino acid ABC transporter substrate-binding protein [Bacteroidetes bacterium]|nr:amino acid ABC transporter substrate-binding protein [Bacteroidota bacterium]
MAKLFIFLTILLFLFVQSAYSQTFKDGLTAFENKDYETALGIFSTSSDQESVLFQGKTLYHLNRLDEARMTLIKVLHTDSPTIKAEAFFILAQISVNEHNTAKALDFLYEIHELPRGSGAVKSEAKILFNQLVTFLSFSERFEVIKHTRFTPIIEEVIREGLRVELKKDAATLLHLAENLHRSGLINEDLIREFSIAYKKNTIKIKRINGTPPDGFNYSIGVILPANQNSPTFEVSKHLYLGVQTAIEEYNQQNASNKIYLSFKNDSDSINTVASLITEESADILIGPLTSESAKDMVHYAEMFSTPMIAPLANNDSLTIDNSFFFQLNPSFKTVGKRMADFAATKLNVQTVAIMADKNSMGYLAALAFKEEMERRNVDVVYFFTGEFQKTGFDISEFTKYFTSDQVLKDSLEIPQIDAVYFPYTGEHSQTLIDLTLTDLEAGRSEIPILGSQDWGYLELPPERLKKFTIYFPDAKELNEEDENVIQFRQNFMDLNHSIEPNYFSFLGYDLGSYITEIILTTKKPSEFRSAIKTRKPFMGIATEISFLGTHINQSVYIFKLDHSGISKAFH